MRGQEPRPPTDLRRQRNKFNRALLWLALFLLVVVGRPGRNAEAGDSGLWLALFLLVVVGGVLIAVFYGASAALLGVACLLAGAGIIGLLWAIFTLIGKWVGE